MEIASFENFFIWETNRKDKENIYSYYFFKPEGVLKLYNFSYIDEYFKELEKVSEKYYLACFFSYELGYYLEDKFLTEKNNYIFPLSIFFIYKKPLIYKFPKFFYLGDEKSNYIIENLKLNTSKEEYFKNIKLIKNYIKEGDIYQINYTMKYKFKFNGSVIKFYNDLKVKQKVCYNAFLNFDNYNILSISPELFFYKKGNYIMTKPMKGTINRGLNYFDDLEKMNFLRNDIKNRSENLMIVDLIRNDLGKICELGSVKVKKLFEVEKYDTLFQMTSTIEGKLIKDIKIIDIVRSLFPSGSVTGAPKIRAMEIINKVEKEPRHIYTGAIGFFTPDGEAKFNVAIRTILINNNYGEMGIGGGIVYDSDAQSEYEEAKLKANFLIKEIFPDFKIIETILFYNKYEYLNLHLKRMKFSALYFDFKFPKSSIIKKLKFIKTHLKNNTKYKIRILLSKDGNFEIIYEPVILPKTYKLKISEIKINHFDNFLYHKTTNRVKYENELKKSKEEGFFDVIFVNENNEITEGAISNIYIEKKGIIYTPPVECGLLNGIIRQVLLKKYKNKMKERKLYINDLKEADAVYISNSIIGFRKAEVII